MKTKNYIMGLLLLSLLLLNLGNVLGAITYNSPTPASNSNVLTDTITASATSTLTNLKNITLVLTKDGTEFGRNTGAVNVTSVSLTVNNLRVGAYVLTAQSFNWTGINETSTRSFNVGQCNGQENYLWAFLLLCFVIGMVYFAVDGFMNGSGVSIAFLVALTFGALMVGSFVLPLLRNMC